MSKPTDKEQRWFDGLTKEERAAAKKCRDSGSLDASTRTSMEQSGLIDGTSSEAEGLAILQKMRF